MRDWAVRAVKTFVQAFFGVLIPEIGLILQGGFPESWSRLWAVLAPVVAAALSAAICAVWNIILEAMKEPEAEEEMPATEPETVTGIVCGPDGEMVPEYIQRLWEAALAQPEETQDTGDPGGEDTGEQE